MCSLLQPQFVGVQIGCSFLCLEQKNVLALCHHIIATQTVTHIMCRDEILQHDWTAQYCAAGHGLYIHSSPDPCRSVSNCMQHVVYM